MPDELTPEAKQLIIHCPHLINRLAASLERTFENLSEDDEILEPIEIRHVEYTAEALGYDDTK